MEDREKIHKLITEHRYDNNTAKLYIESKGKCTYCGTDLFFNLLTYYSGDMEHILPKSKYPELKQNDLNYVVSCRVCNQSKGRKNFLTKDEEKNPIAMLTEHREELINRIKEYIKTKKQEKEKTYEEVKKIIQG